MIAQNPFVNARMQVEKEKFIGREEEIKDNYMVSIEECIFTGDSPSNLAIIGIPGIGKSSLARNAIFARKKDLTDKNIVPIWIDVTSNDSQHFLGTLAYNCAAEMDKLDWLTESLQNSAKEIKEYVQSELDIQDKIRDFFAKVKKAGYGTLFILNRFDHAGSIFEGDMTFQLLNQLANSRDDYRLSWVLTSHQSIEKVEDQAGSVSPFSKLFPIPIRLAMFNDKDLHTYFSKLSETVPISDDDRKRILFYCGCHPYLLQVLGYHIVSMHNKTSTIDVDSTARDSEGCFSTYYRTLTNFLRELKLLEPLFQILFYFSNNVKQNYKNELKELENYGLIEGPEDAPYRAYSDHFHNYLKKLAASLSSPSPTPGSFATSTDATDSTIFIQYKTVSFEEDLHHEFKDISQNNQPVNSIGQIAEEYAVAFLNAEGGSIFWGIRDDGSVVGVELTRSQRDRISQEVSNKLSHISPSGHSLTCKIIFHEVYESDQKTIINDLCVVELAVPKASEVCYTRNGECFVKSYGIKRRLTPREVPEFVQHRSGKV